MLHAHYGCSVPCPVLRPPKVLGGVPQDHHPQQVGIMLVITPEMSLLRPAASPDAPRNVLSGHPHSGEDAVALSASKLSVPGGEPMCHKTCSFLLPCSCKVSAVLARTGSPQGAIAHTGLWREAVKAPLPILGGPWAALGHEPAL